ncbi:putative monooxygenase [Tricladium varicosporioides]|nr:putative monooxygenase [Hymenoscyphus varicosporioides]
MTSEAVAGRPKELEVDVCIIGAGPTGLTTALLASKLGLSVCIVDRAEGRLQVGRADALNARTQQLLDNIGILPGLLALGVKCNTSSTYKDGDFTSRQSKWWTSLTNSRFKEFLMIAQPEVEQALVDGLGIFVYYNTEVESIEESASEVLTMCHDLTIRSKYTVGADGAHSATRKLVGIEFSGTKPNMRWAVLDTFLKTDFPVCCEIIAFEKDGQSRVSWIPRERGLARFYVLLDGEITQENTERSIREHMAPYNVEFVGTEWFSQFDVQERVARTFISRGNHRIVLAGDAAHVHSVNGGQGLNTGISDAFALAWRLNMASKNENPAFLNSYDEERRTVAQGVVDIAGKLVRSTMRTAEEYVSIIEKHAGNITGMGITYPMTTPFAVPGCYGEFVAGARCPDFPFTRSDGSVEFLYQIFEYGKFVVLSNSALQLIIPTSISQYVLEWKVSLAETRFDSFKVEIPGEEKVLSTTFDLGKGEDITVIIRPDLYVGYVGLDPSSYCQGIALSSFSL